jgi:hypothetical protein
MSPLLPAEAANADAVIPYAAPDCIPRLPVLGWSALGRDSGTQPGCVLDLPHVLFTTSGRAAIALALRETGVGRGDRILLPTYHCPTMVAPAVQVGANVDFYPITATGAPDVAYIERAAATGAKALLVAHYFGFPRPLAELRRVCDKHGVALIEDCAHALFGVTQGRPIGQWGDYAIASLTKFLPVSEGGCLVSATRPIVRTRTRPRGARSELKALVDMLEVSAAFGRLRGLSAVLSAAFALKNTLRGRGPRKPVPIPSGWSEDELLAEFDPSRVDLDLSRVARWVAAHTHRTRLVEGRRRNYARLAALVAGLPGTQPLLRELPPDAVPYVFPLWSERPDERFLGLWARGIPAFRWDRLWPGTPEMTGDHGPAWSRHVIQLPCHQDLSDRDLEVLGDTLRQVFR